MTTLLMLYGLPASGKSTYARTLVDEGWVEVNKDDLRAELLEGNWNPRKEKRIVAGRDIRIIQALQAGKNVVSSDTNFGKHQHRLAQLARENGADFQVQRFDIDLQTAIERDLGRANSVGERVIRRMWERYEQAPKNGTRKEFALWINQNVPSHARKFLFGFLDGREPALADIAATYDIVPKSL